MKKIFLLLAFTGIVGASSASTLVTLNNKPSVTFKQDDKKKKGCCKKDATHDCSKHEKGKCNKEKSDSTKHDCSKHQKAKKDSTKHGATPAVPPAK